MYEYLPMLFLPWVAMIGTVCQCILSMQWDVVDIVITVLFFQVTMVLIIMIDIMMRLVLIHLMTKVLSQGFTSSLKLTPEFPW